MENETQGNDYALKFLADMEAKYAALGNAIASVRAALNIGALGGLGATTEGASAGPSGPGSPGTVLPRGAFLGKTISEAIKLYLNAIRARKNNKEIAQALKEGGAVSTGNFEKRVTGTLFQLKSRGEVLRFEDGWGLAEWYPESFRTRIVEKTASEEKKRKRPTPRKAKAQKAKPVKPAAEPAKPESVPQADAHKPEPDGKRHFEHEIEEYFASHGAGTECSLQELAEALGVNNRRLVFPCANLVRSGKLEKTSGSKYRLSKLQQMPKAS